MSKPTPPMMRNRISTSRTLDVYILYIFARCWTILYSFWFTQFFTTLKLHLFQGVQLISNNDCNFLFPIYYILISFIHCMVLIISRLRNGVVTIKYATCMIDMRPLVNRTKSAGVVGYKLDPLKNVQIGVKK